MKRIGMLGLLLMFVLVTPLFAQSEENAIAYGETIVGEITNRHFDVIYVFTGEEDDLVVINLIRYDNADYDPFLYLTTPENEIIAQNDDFYNLNSRIIAQLPADGEYFIVATRRGERSGTGQGGYELSLDNGQTVKLETTIEGQATMGGAPPTHVFVADTSGVYTIQYNHIRGTYFPSLTVSMINEDSYYEEDISQLSGRGLQGGTIQLMLDRDVIYVLTLEQNNYDYSADEGDTVLYTLAIQPSE
jgi:hypothetical protein